MKYLRCMAQEIQPIKRSKQLAPLSREHHDGLLFAWKIKQGLENKTPLEKLRRYSLWYWQQHIKPHFCQEEKILMPYMPADHPMAKQLKEEHEHIRELVLSLDAEADKRDFVILADLVNKHIRFEERELFVYLEELLTTEQLNKVYQELEQHPLTCNDPKSPVWDEEFWIKK